MKKIKKTGKLSATSHSKNYRFPHETVLHNAQALWGHIAAITKTNKSYGRNGKNQSVGD